MNKKSRTKNSIRNVITGFGGQAIQILMGFISRTIFIKYLGAEYLGINGLFTNILSLLSLAELGVGSAIIYALYKPIANSDEVKIKTLMSFYKNVYGSIGIVITIIGLITMPFLGAFIKDTPDINESIYLILIFYLFNTVITYFYSYKGALITADQKNYVVSLINYGSYIFQSIIQIILLIITQNFILYLAVQSICIFINNFIVSKTTDKLYPYLKGDSNEKLSKREKKSLIKNIKALMIVKISGVLVNNTDNIIISYFSGITSIGLVSNYNLIINSINSALVQIFNGLTASIGNLNVKEDCEKREKTFNIINLLNFWFFGLASIGIILLSNDVIYIWLGDKYVLSKSILIVLVLNFYMMGMQNGVNVFKNTMGLFIYGKYLLLITAAINLILSFSLGNLWGMFGIFIATAIARLLTNVWYHPYVIYKYGFNKSFIKYIIKYLAYALILVFTTILTGILCNFVKGITIYTIIIKGIICVIVPNIVFFETFMNTEEIRALRKIILKK